jgi:hypothetical protein
MRVVRCHAADSVAVALEDLAAQDAVSLGRQSDCGQALRPPRDRHLEARRHPVRPDNFRFADCL